MNKENRSLDNLITDMIQEAVNLGGVPAGNKQNFRDAITVYKALDLVILWYNIGNDTYILKKPLS